MKLLIDMNLSPKWVAILSQAGWEAVHWSKIGKHDAPDHEILSYAKTRGFVVFTHDLDFSAILAATQADCPSVIQIRTQDVAPGSLGPLVVSALSHFQKALESGSIITIDQKGARARILPLKSDATSDSPA